METLFKIVLGWAIPLVLGWLLTRISKIEAFIKDRAFWASIIGSFVLIIPTIVASFIIYDIYFSRNTRSTIKSITSDRSLGSHVENTTNKSRIVMISANRNPAANTLYAFVSKNKADLPKGPTMVPVTPDKLPKSAVASVSFATASYTVSLTFVVPPKHHYVVMIDANEETPQPKLVIWTEGEL